jgi:hypothetical protein
LPVSARAHGIMRMMDGSPNEPNATCERCGGRGTVGRAIRTDAEARPSEVHRFCLSCWPEEMARYRARWEEEDRTSRDRWLRNPQAVPKPAEVGMGFEAVTWHLTLQLVRTIRNGAWGDPSPSDLRGLAEEILNYSREFQGEIPLEVETFLREHCGPAV